MFLCMWVGGGFLITWLLAVVLSAATGAGRPRIARVVSLIPTGLVPVLLCATHWAEDDERSAGMLALFAVFVGIVAAGSWLATLLLWRQDTRLQEETGPGLSVSPLA